MKANTGILCSALALLYELSNSYSSAEVSLRHLTYRSCSNRLTVGIESQAGVCLVLSIPQGMGIGFRLSSSCLFQQAQILSYDLVNLVKHSPSLFVPLSLERVGHSHTRIVTKLKLQRRSMLTEPSTLVSLVERLAGSRVLCIGDAMIDRYVCGTVARVSPEAPIPILHIDREISMLGGAGNVVRNLVALGTRPVFVSARGADVEGEELAVLLARHEEVETCLIVDPGRQTPVKTRFVAQAQQLLRADREKVMPLSAGSRNNLLSEAIMALEHVSVVILSDYGKGVLADGVAAELIAAAQGRPILVDPKGAEYSCYRGATLLTPNRRELADATRLPTSSDTEVVTAAQRLIKNYAVAAVLTTRSQDGMTLVHADGTFYHLPAEAREVFDVSGAGDTVVATLAAAMACGASLLEATQLSNSAAGIVVSKVGTAVASAADIVAVLRQQNPSRGGESKVVSLEVALEYVAMWRRHGLKVGFTNGCFDLLHPGHVYLLRYAREKCDKLIVGLNSDASVQRLKGPERPIQPETARAVVLASLMDVDLVVPFSDDTPLVLIAAIRPDVLVKGADYTIETIVGSSLVQEYGGKVLLADDRSIGFRTTTTITRIARTIS